MIIRYDSSSPNFKLGQQVPLCLSSAPASAEVHVNVDGSAAYSIEHFVEDADGAATSADASPRSAASGWFSDGLRTESSTTNFETQFVRIHIEALSGVLSMEANLQQIPASSRVLAEEGPGRVSKDLGRPGYPLSCDGDVPNLGAITLPSEHFLEGVAA